MRSPNIPFYDRKLYACRFVLLLSGRQRLAVHVYSGGRWLLGYTEHDEIYHTTPIQHLEFIKYCKSEGWSGGGGSSWYSFRNHEEKNVK